MDNSKQCIKCNNIKPLTNFNKRKDSPDGHKNTCWDCVKVYRKENREYRLEYHKTWYRANKDKVKVRNKNNYSTTIKNWTLLRKYGLTLEDYNNILKSQDGKCAICKKSSNKCFFSVDHCHITNKVRGLLCKRCNTGLGQFEDNKELLSVAIQYLDKSLSL